MKPSERIDSIISDKFLTPIAYLKDKNGHEIPWYGYDNLETFDKYIKDGYYVCKLMDQSGNHNYISVIKKTIDRR